jgi:hypothetical protein
MPKPSLLTPELQTNLANAVAAGIPFAKACEREGIAAKTGQEWIRRGEGRDKDRPSDETYAAFAAAIKRAQAQDQTRRVLRIEQAAKGGAVTYEKQTTFPDGRVVRETRYTEPQWTADAWHLERTDPEHWGRKDRLDVRVKVQEEAKRLADQFGLDPDEVIAEAERIAREGRG